jgi:FixJ family two-component response regulator
MSDSCPLVVVVDDDASVSESLPELLQELGFAVRTFSSAEALLASGGIADAGCLVVDVEMPRMNGLDLLHELRARGRDIPAVFMTAHTDEAYRRRLMEARPVACLFKPFGERALLEAIGTALKGASHD